MLNISLPIVEFIQREVYMTDTIMWNFKFVKYFKFKFSYDVRVKRFFNSILAQCIE